MSKSNTAVLILAAGGSSRMGSPKQLLAWGEVTLLQNAIAQAEIAEVDRVVVVLGANANSIKNTIPKTVSSVENKDWQTGMGSSIACGMRFLEKSKVNYSSVLILLADQPFIDAQYINQMVLTMKKEAKGIIATTYNGRAGVPALFSNKYFTQLEKLNSEFGAKELLSKNTADIHLLHAGNKTIDIDTQEEYQKLNKLNR